MKTDLGNGNDLSTGAAKNHISGIIDMVNEEANRLTALMESQKISVQEYKRMMWENLGIHPRCIVEGVSYVTKPASSNARDLRPKPKRSVKLHPPPWAVGKEHKLLEKRQPHKIGRHGGQERAASNAEQRRVPPVPQLRKNGRK